MHNSFLKWIEGKQRQLKMLSIATDDINIVTNTPNPSVTVDHSSPICIGRVSVWETGLMDMEVLAFSTGERLYLEHIQLKDDADFDRLLKKYFSFFMD